MKKALVISIAVVLALFVAIAAAGCVGSEPIVGKWNTSTFNLPVTFNNDGTGSISATILGITTSIDLQWTKVSGKDKTYNITGSSEALPVGTYTLSSDGKSLVGPVTLIKAQ